MIGGPRVANQYLCSPCVACVWPLCGAFGPCVARPRVAFRVRIACFIGPVWPQICSWETYVWPFVARYARVWLYARVRRVSLAQWWPQISPCVACVRPLVARPARVWHRARSVNLGSLVAETPPACGACLALRGTFGPCAAPFARVMCVSSDLCWPQIRARGK